MKENAWAHKQATSCQTGDCPGVSLEGNLMEQALGQVSLHQACPSTPRPIGPILHEGGLQLWNTHI